MHHSNKLPGQPNNFDILPFDQVNHKHAKDGLIAWNLNIAAAFAFAAAATVTVRETNAYVKKK